MRVAFFPNHWRNNPYLNLLESGLSEFGIEVDSGTPERPFIWWLRQNKERIDVLHFHWLHYIYQYETYKDSFIAMVKFGVQLFYARYLGYKIVWTAHNLFPHERKNPYLDILVRKLIIYFANAVIVHCMAAKSLFEETFGQRVPVFVVPHGNYLGVYNNEVTREEARNELGIGTDKFVFLHQGSIRAYKGISHLIDSFINLPNPNFILLIAGKVDEEFLIQSDEIKNSLIKDPRIKIHFDWVPDHKIQAYYKAANVAVYPFVEILTSGSIVLALSFGLPVIAPAKGCLPELISPEAGILYDPSNQSGLKDALLRATTSNLAKMGENAYQIAQSLTWYNYASITNSAYNVGI